ncbi:MAG: hypothetical protein U0169_14790 [Polyangiaceae bacterium]
MPTFLPTSSVPHRVPPAVEGAAHPAPLAHDTRGAVMVVGVFMSAFLVGALWYVIGVGDAILYREAMQDGADATAFASAVYHARGMNIIAMLNLIMAAVLAILVALKIAQALLIITNIISCALAWTGIGAAVCAATSAAEAPLQQVIDKVETIVDKVLRGLNKASTGVAMGMPWIAEAKAVTVARSYGPTVEGGMMFSSSQVPSGAMGSSDRRLGLPVSEDSFDTLCDHAAKVVGDVALAPLDALGIPTSWAKGFLGGIVTSFPQYFCGGGGDGGTDKPAVKQNAADLCRRQKEEIDKDNAAHPDRPKKSFDMFRCLMDASKAASNYEKDGRLSGSLGKKFGDTDGKTPKKVSDGCVNGDDHFAIWSTVWGDVKKSGAAKGVEIASWNKRKAQDPSPIARFQVAKAEFYYDASGVWGDMVDDAMWNMRWRARLRRVRSPVPKLGAMMAVAVNGRLGTFGDAVLGGAASKAVDFMSTFPTAAGDWADGAAKGKIADWLGTNGNFDIIH